MRVLLLAQLDFARQTFADGVGQSVEFVKYSNNPSLYFKSWNGNFQFDEIGFIDGGYPAFLF